MEQAREFSCRSTNEKEKTMSEISKRFSGGCLCGELRYEASGEPKASGHCYCCDCRKASGSGFIPFMAFPASAVRLTGETRIYESRAANGNTATRNFCPFCHSLVMGGAIGKDSAYNIYAGSLDDPALKVLDIGK
jgi:hypothetical protein